MPEELSPAEEARLRRLLARSRHDEAVPDDVSARLEDVLARLDAGEPVGEEGPETSGASGPVPGGAAAPPVDLAARRRRRALRLLVAAAAVVVLGIGADRVLAGAGTGGDWAAGEAEDAAASLADPSEGRASDEDLAELESQEYAEGPAEDLAESSAGGAATLSSDGAGASSSFAAQDIVVVGGRLVEVRERDFTEVAVRLQRRLTGVPRAAAGRTGAQGLDQSAARVQRAWQGCAPPQPGPGTPVAVLYDGTPAVLVLRPPEGETQVAALLQCDTGEVLRSATLPLR